MIRKAKVSGTFYPGSASELKEMITTFLDKAVLPEKYEDILGVIVPHAGYIYSGQCAAYGFKALQDSDFDRAFIIAPSHRFGDFQYSVGNFSAYETPLGEIKVDGEYTEKLLQTEGFEFLPVAHNSEHSLEVQLPFLQMIKPECKIVPILFGRQNSANSRYLADVLQKVLGNELKNTRIIVSSDLSHYYSSEIAEEKDKELIGNVEELAVESLVKSIRSHNVEACGFGGIITLMEMAKKLHFDRCEILNYTHSGEISGDRSQVVGYLSALYHK